MKIYELIDLETKNIYNIDALTWVKKEDSAKFKKILPNLACPCCHCDDYEVVYLKEKSYLKTNPLNHLEFCDYYLEKITDKDVNKLIIKNDTSLKNYLTHALHKEAHQDPISKKSLEFKLNKYDYNKPVIFYGTVKTKYLGTSELHIENYQLITKNNEIINLGISKKAAQIIEKRYGLILKENKTLDLAFISTLKREKRFNNINIAKSNCMLIKENVS